MPSSLPRGEAGHRAGQLISPVQSAMRRLLASGSVKGLNMLRKPVFFSGWGAPAAPRLPAPDAELARGGAGPILLCANECNSTFGRGITRWVVRGPTRVPRPRSDGTTAPAANMPAAAITASYNAQGKTNYSIYNARVQQLNRLVIEATMVAGSFGNFCRRTLLICQGARGRRNLGRASSCPVLNLLDSLLRYLMIASYLDLRAAACPGSCKTPEGRSQPSSGGCCAPA